MDGKEKNSHHENDFKFLMIKNKLRDMNVTEHTNPNIWDFILFRSTHWDILEFIKPNMSYLEYSRLTPVK